MMQDNLNVWFETSLIGQIFRDISGKMGFEYKDTWLKEGFPISQQLPLQAEKFLPSEGKAHHFFTNLLPEAGARAHIVRDLKIVDSDFELLKAIGGECAGALSILPMDHKPNPQFNYVPLTEKTLKKMLLRKGSIVGFTTEQARPRLSLAGAQDKCPIYYKDDCYYLLQDSAPSTHIIKFEVSEYRHIPIYEFFLSKLANSIGLPVVECDLRKVDQEHFLLIKRYDRILSDHEKITRLHQEDFCQALGVGYEKKYQVDGGPSFKDCYKMLQAVSIQPLQDSENLIKWQIFNLLAGNSDGHAKNLALLYNKNTQPSLAPFYDLVCTRAIERIDTKLAQAIGGEFDPGKVNMHHWRKLAQECHIREQYLRKLLREMAQQLSESVIALRKQVDAEIGPYPALQRVQQVVIKQCQKTLKQCDSG